MLGETQPGTGGETGPDKGVGLGNTAHSSVNWRSGGDTPSPPTKHRKWLLWKTSNRKVPWPVLGGDTPGEAADQEQRGVLQSWMCPANPPASQLWAPHPSYWFETAANPLIACVLVSVAWQVSGAL